MPSHLKFKALLKKKSFQVPSEREGKSEIGKVIHLNYQKLQHAPH